MRIPKSSFVAAAILLLVAPVVLGQTAETEKQRTKKPNISAANGDQLRSNVGKKVRVRGRVQSVEETANDGLRFLNFSENVTSGFAAALLPAVHPSFPNLDEFVGKRVRVRGKLEMYGDRPVIRVTRPKQVKILEPKNRRKNTAE